MHSMSYHLEFLGTFLEKVWQVRTISLFDIPLNSTTLSLYHDLNDIKSVRQLQTDLVQPAVKMFSNILKITGT